MYKSICAYVLSLGCLGSAFAQWSDNFDSYANGSTIAGQGGWELWQPEGGNNATVTTEQASSSPHSLKATAFTDVVQRFSIDDGSWVFTIDTYIPSAATGNGYIIMMNQYPDPGTRNWSLQVRLSPDQNIVENQSTFGFATLPLVENAWASFRAEINLDTDCMNLYYNGALLAEGLVWSENVSGGGITSIANLDLYSDGINVMYFDNASLQRGEFSCRVAGCDGCDTNCDGSINGFDIQPFVEILQSGGGGCSECAGDTNQDGSINGFDIQPFVNCLGG